MALQKRRTTLLKRVSQVRILPGARRRSARHQRKYGGGPILFCPAVTGTARPSAAICAQYVPKSDLRIPVVPERLHDAAARDGVLAVDAHGVDLQQDVHRAPGPLGDLRGRYADWQGSTLWSASRRTTQASGRPSSTWFAPTCKCRTPRPGSADRTVRWGWICSTSDAVHGAMSLKWRRPRQELEQYEGRLQEHEKLSREHRVRTTAQRILHRHLLKAAAQRLRWSTTVDLSAASSPPLPRRCSWRGGSGGTHGGPPSPAPPAPSRSPCWPRPSSRCSPGLAEVSDRRTSVRWLVVIESASCSAGLGRPDRAVVPTTALRLDRSALGRDRGYVDNGPPRSGRAGDPAAGQRSRRYGRDDERTGKCLKLGRRISSLCGQSLRTM
jgi:hypothetical protein